MELVVNEPIYLRGGVGSYLYSLDFGEYSHEEVLIRAVGVDVGHLHWESDVLCDLLVPCGDRSIVDSIGLALHPLPHRLRCIIDGEIIGGTKHFKVLVGLDGYHREVDLVVSEDVAD